MAITVGLLAGLAAANPGVDPAGRLAAMHRDHLAALQDGGRHRLDGTLAEPAEQTAGARTCCADAS